MGGWDRQRAGRNLVGRKVLEGDDLVEPLVPDHEQVRADRNVGQCEIPVRIARREPNVEAGLALLVQAGVAQPLAALLIP